MSRVRIMPTLKSSGGSLRAWSGDERRDIDEGRQPALPRAGPQPRLDAGDVARIDGEHEVGRRQRPLDRAMAEPRRTLGTARRMRGLGDDVGNAERARHQRAEPVGLAVVAVIGEPEVEALGMTRRQGVPARDETRRLRAGAPLQRQMRLGLAARRRRRG